MAAILSELKQNLSHTRAAVLSVEPSEFEGEVEEGAVVCAAGSDFISQLVALLVHANKKYKHYLPIAEH
uniref:Uncharacterized protein n=1 Tax=Parascaris equorum TaxID=6256 RepID=A0A914S9F6_PAREQ